MNSFSCKSCRFFSSAHLLGACRRYPQLLNKHENDWCGEYQAIYSKEFIADSNAVEKDVRDFVGCKTQVTLSSAENKEVSSEVKDVVLPKKRGRKKKT